MTFHVQLAWYNWMVVQLDSGETESIDPPDCGTGITMLETHNNVIWLLKLSPPPGRPSVAPPLQHLHSLSHQQHRGQQHLQEELPRQYPWLVAIKAVL
jgi:hypothetical protein